LNTLALRRKKVRTLAKGHENVLVTRPQNLFYLTGFWGGGVGVVLDDRVVIVTSKMEKERAEKSTVETEVMDAAAGDLWKEVRKLLRSGSSVADSSELEGKGIGKLSVDPEILLRARRTKDRDEIEKIEVASRKIDRIYELLEREARGGMTEREVAADALRAAILEGLTPFGSEGSLSPVIVAAGENGAFPHSEISDRVLKEGDLVVVDLFFRFEGYGSDETRTFGVGSVSKERRDAYQRVLEAQKTGIALSRSGSKANELHAEVSKALGPLSKYFTHGTGHGVGIDIHEMPSIGKAMDNVVVLQESDVITIEPGIYKPGNYGIRIEDTVLVGIQPAVLTHYTKDLVSLG
jgi:Xaa-Pro aminopeptidase/Xaa-Pro dipeptidase